MVPQMPLSIPAVTHSSAFSVPVRCEQCVTLRDQPRICPPLLFGCQCGAEPCAHDAVLLQHGAVMGCAPPSLGRCGGSTVRLTHLLVHPSWNRGIDHCAQGQMTTVVENCVLQPRYRRWSRPDHLVVARQPLPRPHLAAIARPWCQDPPAIRRLHLQRATKLCRGKPLSRATSPPTRLVLAARSASPSSTFLLFLLF